MIGLFVCVQGKYIVRDGKKVLVLPPHVMQQYKENRLNIIVLSVKFFSLQLFFTAKGLKMQHFGKIRFRIKILIKMLWIRNTALKDLIS